MTRCATPIRSGECQLDTGHRGPHTVRAFYCEACGKHRAGVPDGQVVVRLGDGTVDDQFDVCFLCVRGLT